MLKINREQKRLQEQKLEFLAKARRERNLLFLKVKAKSLAEEAKIIRKEEIRIKNMKYFDEATQSERNFTMWKLHVHRANDVRNESRATHLARTFLRGKGYSTVENLGRLKDSYTFLYIVIPRVLKIINKYGDKTTEHELKKWYQTT